MSPFQRAFISRPPLRMDRLKVVVASNRSRSSDFVVIALLLVLLMAMESVDGNGGSK